MNRTLASPNHMVWQLFEALRRLCLRVGTAEAEKDESALRQDAALCIMLSVQCVEVFFNVYFKALSCEPVYLHSSEKISSDLAKPNFGLDKKIKDWPLLVFGKKLSLDRGAGQRFVSLKKTRNDLMHFQSSNESYITPSIAIHGLADISQYETLSRMSAIDALNTAEAFLCEVFLLRGISYENLPLALRVWTGRPPI